MSLTLATNALTTAAAAYEALGLGAVPGGGASDLVVRRINSVSQQIENYLGRKLQRKVFSTTTPEQLRGSGGVWLFLSRWPIETVERVRINEETLESDDYGRSADLDEKGILHRVNGWPRQVGMDPLTGDPGNGERAFNVDVAYTGGYKLPNDSGSGTVLPSDLEQICLDELVMAYRAPRHNIAEEVTPGGHRRKYAGVTGETRSGLSKASMKALDFYRRKWVGHP